MFSGLYNKRKDEILVQFAGLLAEANFTSDIVIDYDRRTPMTHLSYRVDERTRRIAFYFIIKKAQYFIADLSQVIRVEFIKNHEIIGYISLVDGNFGAHGTIRQVPAISSIYLDFYTNNPQEPVSKLGLTFGTAKPESHPDIKDIVYWFHKVYASLQLVIPKYGARLNT